MAVGVATRWPGALLMIGVSNGTSAEDRSHGISTPNLIPRLAFSYQTETVLRKQNRSNPDSFRGAYLI